jgi:hypothetical protein
VSTILKALKRLEDETRGDQPRRAALADEVLGEGSQARAPVPPPPAAPRRLAPAAGGFPLSFAAGALAAGILVGFFVWQLLPAAPPAPPAGAEDAAVTASSRVRSEPAPPAAQAVGSGRPARETAPSPPPEVPPDWPEVAPLALEPAPAAAARDAREPMPRPAAQQPRTPAPSAAAPAPRPTRIPVPDVAVIPPPPEIRVARTVWHPTPGRRVATVQMEGRRGAIEVREGDALGTLVVLAIEPSGVVFLHGSERLRRGVGGVP